MHRIITALILFISLSLQAKVSLPAILGSHMVMQQQSQVKLWGWCDAAEDIIIKPSWSGQSYQTTGTGSAKWEVTIATPKAGGPYTISIQGKNEITLEDVLIGEVWICSGQSNMEWTTLRSGSSRVNTASTTRRCASTRATTSCADGWASGRAARASLVRPRSARKIYWALVPGVPKVKQGRVSTWLAKGTDEKGDQKMKIARHGAEGADHALTYYAVVDTAAQKMSWLSLKPVTGRTHQLRVHAAEIGHPIVGDPKYFDIENWQLAGGIQSRLHVLARRIMIPHPRAGEILVVSAPLPPHPIHIDPTVFGTTTTWTGINGADDAPNWCTGTSAVPTPANATLTGSSIYWEFVATGANCPRSCRMKDLQVQIFTICDYGPTPLCVWICLGAPCNTDGIWLPTIDDATTADLVTCFTPQCASYNINFTINYNQFNCVTAGTCVVSCAYLQEFAVTIEGETLTATALAEGVPTYIVVDCTDQSGWLSTSTPNYGVPPYTYVWTPGGYTFSPVYVTFPMGVTVYTVTMTDACGQVFVETVTVTNNCVTLPIELLSFSGQHVDGANFLQWSIAPEMVNKAFSKDIITRYKFRR